jgi:hypothetical protein
MGGGLLCCGAGAGGGLYDGCAAAGIDGSKMNEMTKLPALHTSPGFKRTRVTGCSFTKVPFELFRSHNS